MGANVGKQGGAHIATRTYVYVGLFLAAVTAVEVAIPFIALLKPVMVPLLLVLGAVKFWTVARYFMHLKFDRRVLTWVFAAGLAFALVVTVGLVLVMAA